MVVAVVVVEEQVVCRLLCRDSSEWLLPRFLGWLDGRPLAWVKAAAERPLTDDVVVLVTVAGVEVLGALETVEAGFEVDLGNVLADLEPLVADCPGTGLVVWLFDIEAPEEGREAGRVFDCDSDVTVNIFACLPLLLTTDLDGSAELTETVVGGRPEPFGVLLDSCPGSLRPVFEAWAELAKPAEPSGGLEEVLLPPPPAVKFKISLFSSLTIFSRSSRHCLSLACRSLS